MEGYICITGVSSGLGRNTAKYLNKKGFHIIGTVRNASDGMAVQGEISRGFDYIITDVTSDDDVLHLAAEVNRICGDQGLKGLINNAGVVESGPLMYMRSEKLSHQLDVNVVGVHRVTQALFPTLRKCEDSRIINISSVSGRIGFPFVGAYATSKFALEAYTDVLRRELIPFDIQVSVLQPSATKTPMWDKNESVLTDYANTPYGRILEKNKKLINRPQKVGMEPEEISKKLFEMMKSKRMKTRYLLSPDRTKFKILSKLFPDRWLDRLIYKKMFLRKGKSQIDLSK
ncbi:MAG: SDR family NAD(P)-dependent oxidoreductase [Saprospiraceae bacterium]|nr:SDR family NAD(P)-dependent oxidoreductase [Saprospiraceae bacterium]